MRHTQLIPGALALAVALCPVTASHATEASASPSIIEKTPKTVAPPAGEMLASIEKPKSIPAFDAGHAAFSLRVAGTESSLGTLPAFVLPGEAVEFSAVGGSGTFTAETERGTLAKRTAASWIWTAPKEHGDHKIRIRDAKGGTPIVLQVFVLRQYDGNGKIGEYRIGAYQREAKDGNPVYTAPAGFVEVTAQNIDTRLTPHFRLGQFICKDKHSFPKYVALQTALLVKLEALLEALAERGLPAETLHVMSGYRTPAYNAGIGNQTIYSRHTYGDAADVFLDRDGDGKQDDLNNDGKSTREDARILYQLVEETIEAKLPAQMAGGLAIYNPNAVHGPFIHIDTRGHRARW